MNLNPSAHLVRLFSFIQRVTISSISRPEPLVKPVNTVRDEVNINILNIFLVGRKFLADFFFTDKVSYRLKVNKQDFLQVFQGSGI